MNPDRVYELTTPNNHKTNKITAMVTNMVYTFNNISLYVTEKKRFYVCRFPMLANIDPGLAKRGFGGCQGFLPVGRVSVAIPKHIIGVLLVSLDELR